MKKALYLILLTLSLACFTACGSSTSDGGKQNSENSESEISWEEQQALEEQKWIAYWSDIICDTWLPRSADTKLGDVVISKDGTLSFNGGTYPYKFTYVDEYSFSCYAYDGDAIKYSISYTKADPTNSEFEKHFEELFIMVPNGENSYTTADGGGYFYRKSSYEAIEITLDNWDTYFEFVTQEKQNINAFGELELIYLESFYKIKDEYNDRVNCALSNVVFEVQTTEAFYYYTIDTSNNTYTLVERNNDREDIDTYTYEFRAGHYSGYKDISYLSTCIHGCYIYADRDHTSGYLDSAEVLRTTGTLYLEIE